MQQTIFEAKQYIASSGGTAWTFSLYNNRPNFQDICTCSATENKQEQPQVTNSSSPGSVLLSVFIITTTRLKSKKFSGITFRKNSTLTANQHCYSFIGPFSLCLVRFGSKMGTEQKFFQCSYSNQNRFHKRQLFKEMIISLTAWRAE